MSKFLSWRRVAGDRAFGIACWTLAGFAFILLLMVGISFSLSSRTLVVEKEVRVAVIPPVQDSVPAASPGVPVVSVSAPEDLIPESAVTPRSVDQMLEEDMSDPDVDAGPLAVAPAISGSGSPETAELDSKMNGVPEMTEQVADLVRAARYAQIEGDLKIAVLKLEEALRLEPENPVVLYYYGLTYEWLRNADKSREFFMKVYTQRDKAGKYFSRAAKHLQAGFSSAADMRGNMSFGTILEYKEPDCPAGEKVTLTVPIFMKDGLNVRPEDLHIRIQFFDKVNGKKVEMTRAPEPASKWITDTVDWSDGEEIMEVTYCMPPLTEEEAIAFGSLKYYGYTAKLYYKGEPMDCHASPPVLFLLEQMKQNTSGGMPDIYEGGLLPPVDAVPVSDSYDTLLPP